MEMFQFVRAIVPYCPMVPATEPDFIFSIRYLVNSGKMCGAAIICIAVSE